MLCDPVCIHQGCSSVGLENTRITNQVQTNKNIFHHFRSSWTYK